MWLLSFLYPLLFVSACIQCIHVEDAKPFFRKDYEFNADTQNFYKVHTAARTWGESKTRCELEGASLFVADSKQDNDAVAVLMVTKEIAFEGAWIGIHDQYSEADFVTIDGVSIDEVYHQWASYEPNNNNGNENCVSIHKNGKLFDLACEKSIPFICKKSRTSLHWNILCDIPDQSYHYQRELGRCYKLHLQPRTWRDAYGVCTAEQSYLTIINSKAESDHLVKMIGDATKGKISGNVNDSAHIGIHSQIDDRFTTIQGVKLENTGYAVWGEGQPDNAGGQEKCGSMFYYGTLNDISCNSLSIFICEHDIGRLAYILEERVQNTASNEP